MEDGLSSEELQVQTLQWLFLEQGVDALQRQCTAYSNTQQVMNTTGLFHSYRLHFHFVFVSLRASSMAD